MLLEDDSDPHQLELTDELDALRGISGEAGDGFGDDQVDLLMLAQSNHLLEFGSLISSCACDTLVSEDIYELPIGTGLNGFCVVPYLGGIGV